MRSRALAAWRLVMLLAGLLSASPSVRAEQRAANLPPGDSAAIQSVIREQIGAFRRDDAAAAFAFASPGIQQQFGDAATFMGMVRRGYAPVYRPGSFAFGPLVEIDGKIVQRVELIGPGGEHDRALYFMERESDGSWRIDGCILEHRESVGA